jgi:23S rRNA G2069 N7-methylase RlmK/C1962 C5-methylase RlmI
LTCGGPEPPRLLNPFAYTGVASLLAVAAGAQMLRIALAPGSF